MHIATFLKKSLFAGAAALLLLPSCNKRDLRKIAGVKWNPQLATPIGFADFDVYDVLAAQDSSDLVIIDPLDGSIALVYDGELASFTAATVIQLPDYSTQFNESAAELGVVAIPAFNGTASASFNENIDFPVGNGIELHTVNFEDGNLALGLQTSFRHDVSIALTFPDIRQNGVPVQRTLSVNYTGSVPQSTSLNVDMANLSADFTANGSATNRLRVQAAVTITGTGEPITGTENIAVSAALLGLEFRNITGYFGQQLLASTADTIDIRLFDKNSTTGTFTLTNPSIKFTADNSFGMPINLHFNQLKTVNVNDGTQYPLTGFPADLTLNAPAALGQSATTTLLLNTSNTQNLNTILSPTPKYFIYDVTAESNPAGNTGTLNFVEADSRFVLRGELTLPLQGYAYGLTFSDTLPFNLTEDVSKIESALFRINATNSFPVSFKAQAVFTDANYNPLFTLLDIQDQLIVAAPVNTSGKVTSAANKITDVVLDEAKVKQMGMAKHVIIIGGAATTGPQGTVVKFFDSYKFSVKLGMQVKINSTL